MLFANNTTSYVLHKPTVKLKDLSFLDDCDDDDTLILSERKGGLISLRIQKGTSLPNKPILIRPIKTPNDTTIQSSDLKQNQPQKHKQEQEQTCEKKEEEISEQKSNQKHYKKKVKKTHKKISNKQAKKIAKRIANMRAKKHQRKIGKKAKKTSKKLARKLARQNFKIPIVGVPDEFQRKPAPISTLRTMKTSLKSVLIDDDEGSNHKTIF